jgi:hypothetical protein
MEPRPWGWERCRHRAARRTAPGRWWPPRHPTLAGGAACLHQQACRGSCSARPAAGSRPARADTMSGLPELSRAHGPLRFTRNSGRLHVGIPGRPVSMTRSSIAVGAALLRYAERIRAPPARAGSPGARSSPPCGVAIRGALLSALAAWYGRDALPPAATLVAKLLDSGLVAEVGHRFLFFHDAFEDWLARPREGFPTSSAVTSSTGPSAGRAR